MREIKFRAWHKDIKKMYKIGQITLEKGIWNYEPEDRDFIGMSKPYQPSFILMEYTGLKDKNGKEIYEGDIVKTILYKYKIIFKNCCFKAHCIKNNLEYTLEWLQQATEDANVGLEVIGNIYDNLELLEE